ASSATTPTSQMMRVLPPTDPTGTAATWTLSADGSADVDTHGAGPDGAAAAGLAAVDATAVGDPETDLLGVGDPATVLGEAVVLGEAAVGRGAGGCAVAPPTTMSELPLLWYPSVAMIAPLKPPRFIPERAHASKWLP